MFKKHHIHDFFVPARPFERSERQAAGGGVIKRDSDAPQIHRGSVFLLVVLPQHGSLVHVRMLQTHRERDQRGSRNTGVRFPIILSSSPDTPLCRTATRTARRLPAHARLRSRSAYRRIVRLLRSCA